MNRIPPLENPAFYKISHFDLILIVLVVLFSVLSIPGVERLYAHASAGPARAAVYIGGTLYKETALNTDTSISVPTASSGAGMLVEIKKGKIAVTRSDCPRQICSHQGTIRYPGQTIVCVPNKVLIEIGSDTPSMDAVVQ